ncbi:CaiB/BaiF CoA transferase family protein [Aquisalimonas asiatica]|uniref:Crotonobetainyl-CoA:carnitine CoA-transferase CaiB n=1 Tax=Aquisalimonas asiatica TaxID=406100 RepID=A0A1H8RPM8_9GAMM|nr:CoA transferase [Aquisalimonas asiatica]SEO68519.1 Crotonobetainyl-CoA:carnitine CoA-transferase CaiB [Aquisalimonas asiatica]
MAHSGVSGPLAGIRVVDLTAMVSGPLATMILADQGAEVIKVENPAGGDYTRLAANQRNGFSASFLNNNRNKRSLTLNLKSEAGLAAVRQLVAGADVFIQNFRPGVIERMGLDEATLRASNPGLVYASISGFGDAGPYAAKPVYDPLVQALSGLASVQGGSDNARPQLVRTILPDKLTGMTTAQAVTATLLHRARTGEGQHVRVSMLGAVLAFLWGSDMGSQTFVGDERPQAEAASFIDLIYATADGYISVAVQTDREWQALTRALERPEWLSDPRFLTPALRQEHIDERLQLTQDVLYARTAEAWLERLEHEGVPCAPVLTRSQVIHHPQVGANTLVLESDHPTAGPLRQAAPAAAFSRSPAGIRHGAPALGQDTDAILADLGYSEDERRRLRETGVTAPGETTP